MTHDDETEYLTRIRRIAEEQQQLLRRQRVYLGILIATAIVNAAFLVAAIIGAIIST